MKRKLFAALFLSIVVFISGCGDGDTVVAMSGGGDNASSVTTGIFSDPAFDGDIAQDPVTGAFTVTQGNTQSVFAGIDPSSGAEFRAFLDFPLTGAGGVPGNAIIQSALLDIFINDLRPHPLLNEIPIRLDLVAFQPPTLIGTDFDLTLQPALASTTIIPPLSQNDFGQHVLVDVTPLMAEAQRLGLTNFQLRILRDGGTVPSGLVEINDTTGVDEAALAPLLQVTYANP